MPGLRTFTESWRVVSAGSESVVSVSAVAKCRGGAESVLAAVSGTSTPAVTESGSESVAPYPRIGAP